jgi:uncharacterized membrane protein
MNNRTRLAIFITVFLVLTGVLFFTSSIQLTESQAESLNQGVQGLGHSSIGIFENNVLIALAEFVPGFGPVLGIYTSYSTGLVTAAEAQANPSSGVTGPEALLITMLTPIFWLEFFCYSLAVEESISLIVSFKRKDFFSSEWKWLAGSVLMVVTTLFVSAKLETDLINFLK